MALTLPRLELLGAEIVWLLDLEIAGQVFRFATEDAEVASESGDTLIYVEGLADPGTGRSFDGTAEIAIPIEINSDDAWATIVAQFGLIERTPGTLRQWVEGITLEAAEVVLTGHVSGFTYNEPNDPVSFSLVRRERETSRLIPSSGMVIDDTTWPVRGGFDTDEKILGVRYPMIFGTPGNLGGGVIVAATEAMMVEFRMSPNNNLRLLIAGHRVAAATVTIFDYTDDAPVSNTASVIHEPDGVGRICALVDPQAAGFNANELGRTWYIGWNEPGFDAGNGALVGAGDVIEWILRTWTDIRIDAARFASVRERLNAYQLDPTIINAQLRPSEWLNSELLPLLPVEPQQGEDGLWYRIRRTTAVLSDVVAVLNADTGEVQVASPITWQSGDIVNEVTIEYAEDRGTGNMLRRIVIGAKVGERARPDELDTDLPGTDTRFLGNFRARLSVNLFRNGQSDGVFPLQLQAPTVYDSRTAARIAQDKIEEQALPRRSTSYTAGSEQLGLSEGDVVLIIDTARGINEELAEVRDVVAGGAVTTIPVLFFDDPLLVKRLAG